jgi:hypothetical protein
MAESKTAQVIPGPFEKRADHTISNARLYDLVEDMARVLDTVPTQLDRHERMLNQILEKLNGNG